MIKHGYKRGSRFECFVEQDKTHKQIIERATRSGGGDLF